MSASGRPTWVARELTRLGVVYKRTGDAFILPRALELCARFELAMPQWVAEPYLKAYKGEPEALIKALSRGTAKNIAKVHRKKRRAFQIVKRVDVLHAQGHTKQRGDIYTKLYMAT